MRTRKVVGIGVVALTFVACGSVAPSGGVSQALPDGSATELDGDTGRDSGVDAPQVSPGTDSGVDAPQVSPDVIQAGMQARQEGSVLLLDWDGRADVWALTCDYCYANEERWTGSAWAPLLDERPVSCIFQGGWDGWYLDGTFVPSNLSAGCDVVSCVPLTSGAEMGETTEYVQTGTAPPPTDYTYPPIIQRPATVPVIESRPVHGLMRTHFRYFTGSSCKQESEHSVTFEVTLP